jgi:signal recognition particle subunit SRP54
VPCDLQRPAAIEQLSILAKQAEVDFLELPEPKPKLLEVANLAQEYIKENGIDLVIYDTAGRLQIDTDLMAELLLFEKKVKPEHKLLVVDSLIGQEAANVAATFNTQIGIDAVVLSKLDSDARGGAALSIAEATSKPIKFAAVGEKLDDIENFHPSRIASRILGMGDVLTLVEQAQRKIEEEESKRLEAELMKGNFNFETFMSAQGMMSKLGDIGSLAKMMGMGGMLKQMGLSGSDQEDLFEKSSERMKKFKHAISSMTLVEKRNPKLLTGDASSSRRKARISQGSGLAKSEIDQLISEFNKMNQMFKTFGPMMKMFGGAGGGGGMPNPMAAMTGGGGAGGMNPMAALGNMMNPQQMAESMGLSKSQKRAMQSMGLGGGSPKMKSSKKFKKGQKPKIKGFNEN